MESFIDELETERVEELESYLTTTGLKDCELTEEERAIRSYPSMMLNGKSIR